MDDTKDEHKQNDLPQKGMIFQQDIAPGQIKPSHLLSNPIATGTIYYASNNNFTNLAIGTSYQILTIVSGVPSWITFPRTGTAANRPSSGRFTGDEYFATDTFAFSVWTGAAWKSVTLS